MVGLLGSAKSTRETLISQNQMCAKLRTLPYPPNEYLLMLRLKKSLLLLVNPELSISDVADRVGFSDSNYFYRQFKRHYGLPPQKYRKTRR